MTHPTQIHWTCRECGFRVADRAGTLSLPLPYLGQPEPLHWHPYHYECQRDGERYDIPIEGVRTAEGIVRWTAHLYAKRWAPETDWHRVIGAAVPQRGSGAAV